MKITGSLLLLLLVCSVSTAQLGTLPQKTMTKAPIGITAKTAYSQQPSLQSIYATLRQLSASVAQQRANIQFLQRRTQVQQVVFSASLSAGMATTIGPFSTPTPLVFKHVVTNTGEAYNLDKGVFTAPVRGVYHFEWHVSTPEDASRGLGVHLVKNEDLIADAHELQSSGYASASQSVTLILQAKDVVFLRLWSGSKVSDSENHQSTFSGHLLFTI